MSEELYDNKSVESMDINNSMMNESSSINTENINSSSPSILNILSINSTSIIDTIKNESTLLSTSIPSIISETKDYANSIVDQINSFRNNDIISRIQKCDTNMKLNDLCETYSIDNNTNLLIRQSNIEFNTLQNIFDTLVDRIIIKKLKKICLSSNWCLENLTQDNIYFTYNIIQQHGYSFCLLEKCQTRLLLFINSCPILLRKNISIPTLKLLPMLCTLYNEQQNWNSTQCMEHIVYLLYIFYAFWPQIETCFYDFSAGFNVCTSECEIFDNILNTIENQCNGNISFLSQIPALIWYRSINLEHICYKKNISRQPSFIYSVKNFFSSNKLKYQLYEKPIYTILFIILLIFFIISFSLCFYLKSKYHLNSNNRRFDNNYEYRQLQNSSFELGTDTEFIHSNSRINGTIDDESQSDLNNHSHAAEYQRLLYVDS